MPGKSKKSGGLQTEKYAFKMEDLSGDGKVTQKDILIGKGVLNEDGSKANAMKPKGYQMNYKMVNKEGLKMAGNPAYKLDPTTDLNLSLINDPSKLSGLDLPKVGDNVNFGGENMSVSDVNLNKTFRTKLYSDLDPSIVEAAKKFNLEKYGTHNPTAEGKTNNQTLDSFNAVVNLASIPQPGTPEVKGDAFTSYDKRQRARGIKFEENLISRKDKKGKRLGEVIGKLENKESLNKRQERRLANLKSRQEKNTRIKNRLEDVNKISKKQDLQAINPSVGKKGRVIVKEKVPGSSTTSALPNVKEIFESDKIKILKNKLAKGAGNGMKPMQLSPKAMNYFNKKNKK